MVGVEDAGSLREVLLCGGPNDGEWVRLSVRMTAYVTRVMKPVMFPLESPSTDDFQGQFEDHKYFVEPITLAGERSIWVGMHQDVGPLARDRMLAKALFQRDVYNQMYGQK